MDTQPSIQDIVTAVVVTVATVATVATVYALATIAQWYDSTDSLADVLRRQWRWLRGRW